MIKNFFKIAIRNLFKNKVSSLINLIGLSVGLASCIIIFLYIMQELSYDDFHTNKDRIYRLGVLTESSTENELSSQTPMPAAPAIDGVFPEIEKVARIYFSSNDNFEYGEDRIKEDNLIFADSTFFEIFSFELVSGNKKEVLTAPFSIVMTESSSKKYFGNDNPIGKQVYINNKEYFTVTGITKDPPANTHIKFDFIASYNSLTPSFMGWDPSYQWGAYFGNFTYILTKPNASINDLHTKMKKFTDENVPTYSPDVSFVIVFQSLTETHTDTSFEDTPQPTLSVISLTILGTIGGFLLLIACINFVNLTTARSLSRFKEIGVRKTIGASKGSLIRQFVGESILFTLIALIIGIIISEILLGYIVELIDVSITLSPFSSLFIFINVLVVTITIGLLSGLYPALILSKVNTTLIIKGNIAVSKGRMGSAVLKKALVVLQFVIAVLFITSTLVINSQLNYVQTAPLGFNKDHIIQLKLSHELFGASDIESRTEAFKSELMNLNGVKDVTFGFGAPLGSRFGTNIYPNGRDGGGSFDIFITAIDDNYLEFFSINLLAGEGFVDRRYEGQKDALIINKTMMKKLGFSDPYKILHKRYLLGFNKFNGEIIGVVDDFHNASFRQEIAPQAFFNQKDFLIQASVKLNTDDIPSTIADIETIWKKFSPKYPLDFSFLDESVDKLYEKEQQQANLIILFSIIAIVISCMGLFGLSAFTAQQRTKEIGVRKVIGATVSNIIMLLSKDFLVLTIIANVIALPIAYYFMHQWLSDFAYRVDLSVWIFLGSAVIAIAIAFVTVSYQATKAALSDPVKSLRYE